MKNAVMQVTYFLNGHMFFLSILFYNERKWLLMRNLAVILPLKCKFSGQFQRFDATDKSIKIEMLFPTSHVPPSPTPIKFYYLSETKIFLRRYLQIYRRAFKVLQECSSWVPRNGACNIFSDTKHKHDCFKICKVRNIFGCVAGACYFQCQVSWGS